MALKLVIPPWTFSPPVSSLQERRHYALLFISRALYSSARRLSTVSTVLLPGSAATPITQPVGLIWASHHPCRHGFFCLLRRLKRNSLVIVRPPTLAPVRPTARHRETTQPQRPCVAPDVPCLILSRRPSSRPEPSGAVWSCQLESFITCHARGLPQDDHVDEHQFQLNPLPLLLTAQVQSPHPPSNLQHGPEQQKQPRTRTAALRRLQPLPELHAARSTAKHPQPRRRNRPLWRQRAALANSPPLPVAKGASRQPHLQLHHAPQPAALPAARPAPLRARGPQLHPQALLDRRQGKGRPRPLRVRRLPPGQRLPLPAHQRLQRPPPGAPRPPGNHHEGRRHAPRVLPPRRRRARLVGTAPRLPRRPQHLWRAPDHQLGKLHLLRRPAGAPEARQPLEHLRLRRRARQPAPRPGDGPLLARHPHLPHRGRLPRDGGQQDGRPVPPRHQAHAGRVRVRPGLRAPRQPHRPHLPDPRRLHEPLQPRVQRQQGPLRGPDRGQVLLPRHPQRPRRPRQHAAHQHPEAEDDRRPGEALRRVVHGEHGELRVHEGRHQDIDCAGEKDGEPDGRRGRKGGRHPQDFGQDGG